MKIIMIIALTAKFIMLNLLKSLVVKSKNLSKKLKNLKEKIMAKPKERTPEERKEIEEKNLPEFQEEKKQSQEIPEEEKKDDSSISSGEIRPEILDEICGDICATFFHLWHIWNPNVPKLDPEKKKAMQKYAADMAVKYKLTKLTKTEVIFLALFGNEVLKRMGIKRPPKSIKKNAADHSGQKGQGQDYPG